MNKLYYILNVSSGFGSFDAKSANSIAIRCPSWDDGKSKWKTQIKSIELFMRAIYPDNTHTHTHTATMFVVYIFQLVFNFSQVFFFRTFLTIGSEKIICRFKWFWVRLLSYAIFLFTLCNSSHSLFMNIVNFRFSTIFNFPTIFDYCWQKSHRIDWFSLNTPISLNIFLSNQFSECVLLVCNSW